MNAKYNKVAEYWDKRLSSSNPLSAVLTLNAPYCLNQAYDRWERYSLFSSIKSSLKNKKILDIGAGYGRVCLEFAQQGAQVTAIDLSQNMLSMLENNAKSMNLGDRIKIIEVSSDNFNMNIKYDIIICLGLLEHLPLNARNRTFKNCINHLKKSGQLFTVINNSSNPFLINIYGKQKRYYAGYQTNLIGLNWLRRACRSNKASYDIVASNPNYAILHYFFSSKKLNSNLLSQMSINALRADMLNNIYDNMGKLFASHFMVKIKHKK